VRFHYPALTPETVVTAPFNRIILATENSEFDAGAERVAVDLAAAYRQPLFAVVPMVSNPEYQIRAPEREEQEEAEASAKLDQFEDGAAAKGVEVHGLIRLGEEPFREIVEEAKIRKADLIVIRRRGKRGFLSNLRVGEMVDAVVSHTDRDVLTVPRMAQVWSRGILLATDGAPHSERSAELAMEIALRDGLPLTVVSVAEKSEKGSAEASAQASVERIVATAAAKGLAAKGQVLTDGHKPHLAIVAAAEETQSDLIVVGRRDLSRLKRLLSGSVSAQVAGESSGPVLIVHETPPAL
jgi:nucleotide-binding universal stress UspA family protein